MWLQGDNLYPHHQLLDVLLESVIVEALEGLGVVELAVEGVAGSGVLAKDVEPELIGPPVTVLDVVSACGMHIVCEGGGWWSYLGAARCGVGHTHGAFRGFFSDTTHCDCDGM